LLHKALIIRLLINKTLYQARLITVGNMCNSGDF
jgi:hypothetical protein